MSDAPKAAPETGLSLIVYWRQADWGFYNRRNEALARHLAQRQDVDDVLHLETVSLKGLLASALRALVIRDRRLRRAYRLQVRKALSRRPVRLGEGLRVKSLCLATLSGKGFIAALNQRWLRRQIAALEAPQPAVMLCYPPAPLQETLVSLVRPRLCFADLVDDVPAQEPDPARRAVREMQFVALLSHCQAVFATSQRLAERYAEYAPAGIDFLPNGVSNGGVVLAVPGGRRRPRVGYAGAFNRTLDGALLEHLLAWNADVEFVLVGPARGGDARFLRRLQERFPNCRYLGSKQYGDLQALLCDCDVLVNLKRADESTRGNDSLKIYEYLATGRPVVSTLMPPADRLGDVVYTAIDRETFQQSLRQALDEDAPELRARRRAVAAENGWDRRAACIAERTHELLTPAQPARSRVV